MELEKRSIASEINLAGNGIGLGTLSGLAIMYNRRSESLGKFYEIIAPGAFTESLQTQEVRCLSEHDSKCMLGRTSSNTLRLTDGPTGLNMACDIPETTFGRDLAVQVKRGDIRGCSIGFIATDARWSQGSKGELIRTVHKAKLFEISAVGDPAYLDTTLAIRSLNKWQTDSDEAYKLRLKLNESFL